VAENIWLHGRCNLLQIFQIDGETVILVVIDHQYSHLECNISGEINGSGQYTSLLKSNLHLHGAKEQRICVALIHSIVLFVNAEQDRFHHAELDAELGCRIGNAEQGVPFMWQNYELSERTVNTVGKAMFAQIAAGELEHHEQFKQLADDWKKDNERPET
jgi:hypothetical protein